MKLIFKKPGYDYSLTSLASFIKMEGSFKESIYYFYPELKVFEGQFKGDMDNSYVADKIGSLVSKIYRDRESEIEDKCSSYQKYWDSHKDIIDREFGSIFSLDMDDVFNDFVCNITINPISPRYLKSHEFDVFYLNSERGALGSNLHEIAHYLWFYIWHRKYGDSYKEYEAPSLKWILSEAVVEQLLNTDNLNKINPYHKGQIAYKCFYDMKIDKKPLYDYLNQLYRENNLEDFMDKTYDFFLENEDEIRRQMD